MQHGGYFNMIPAVVKGTFEHIWLELADTTELQIPRQHQLRLVRYLNRELYFGINSEFIGIGKNEEQLNICKGQLISIENDKHKKILRFWVGDQTIIATIDASTNMHADIGQTLTFNFDTYFGHVFDPETQLNLTI